MSFFQGLDTEAYDREYGDRELIRRIFSYFEPHRRRVVIVGILITLNSVAGALQPVGQGSALRPPHEARWVHGARAAVGGAEAPLPWLRRPVVEREPAARLSRDDEGTEEKLTQHVGTPVAVACGYGDTSSHTLPAMP